MRQIRRKAYGRRSERPMSSPKSCNKDKKVLPGKGIVLPKKGASGVEDEKLEVVSFPSETKRRRQVGS